MRQFLRVSMILMALAPLAMAGAVAGPATGATAATACSAWNGAQPVNPAPDSALGGIAVVSACDVWAVGSSSGTGDTHALIEHWTGSSWATALSPVTGFSTLIRASAVSASDIWAVGANSAGALILHYDGTGWTQKLTPPAGNDGTLWDVDGQSGTDAWAAGWTGHDPATKHALMLHWDGTNWNPSSLPSAVTGDGSEILSVSADSATDAWAVAVTSTGFAFLRWDGSQWRTSTVTSSDGPVINSVVALSPTDAWAVGRTNSNPEQTWTEHWDGTNWNVIPSPSPGGTGQTSTLVDVTATSGSDVWAVGSYVGSSPQIPFALHWNGSSWAAVTLPVSGTQATDANPESISAAAPGQAWVSGYSGFHGNAGLSPVAVPVPVVPNVAGQQPSAASTALTAAGLTSTQTQTTSCPPANFGQVASTNPAAGQQAPFGQAVTLTVCAALVTVPDVTGEDDASARSDLTAAGLHVGTITLTVSCTIPKGQVISQNPAGGSQVRLGSSVNLNEATRSGPAAQAAPHFCTK